MSAYALLAHSAANATNAGTLAAASDNAFGKATLNAKLVDSTTFLALSATNTFTHAATGDYRVDGVVAFGYDATMNGVNVRAGLFNVTSGSFATNAGGAVEIISSAGVAADPSAGTGTAFVQIKGRYTVASTGDHYAVYMAGKPTATTWFASSFAQGAAASSVTSGTKPEYYKLVEITQE